ncbi:hypothetical protein AKJ09_01336 [Labilithrix luteola]|uniref:Outer membrane protein beta-barrel domain-containing protein n=1 Tax=Labilithrix luteola TaxID=1391654 RepID=A0A0K1PMB8_9BACT|nr:hypothetical protein [Labilithrix luteola]AKU94672.1 hypothetical protein AKJ09_01336 [Labilithrix luteola]
MSVVKRLAAIALGLAALWPRAASAQEYLPAGAVYVGSGIEGAGRGFQRARTRLRIGGELRVDEAPDEAIFAAVLVDIEPKTAFGGELRYVHTIGSHVAASAGAIAYLAPGTLLGPCAGLEVRVPLASKTYLVAGPEAAVFALGGDLPDNVVVWQALFQLGFRADLK